MANLFAWLLVAVAPLAKQILVALGIGTITYTGVTALLNVVTSTMAGYFGQIGSEVSGLLALSGIFTSAGIFLGAIASRAALKVVARLGTLT